MPDGYRSYAIGSALLVTRPEFFAFMRDALHACDTFYAYAATRASAPPLQGRGATYRLVTPHGEWVVRRYRRGGAIAPLLGDRYLRLGELRPLQELVVSAAARQRGIRTPEIRAFVLQGTAMFVRADLATEYIADTHDLAQLGFGETAILAEQQRAAWHGAGRLVRELATAGLSHADLNLKNILIRFSPGAPEAWVLDLDRGRIGLADAGAMWVRLLRSLAKWERGSGRPLAADLREALEAGYRG